MPPLLLGSRIDTERARAGGGPGHAIPSAAPGVDSEPPTVRPAEAWPVSGVLETDGRTILTVRARFRWPPVDIPPAAYDSDPAAVVLSSALPLAPAPRMVPAALTGALLRADSGKASPPPPYALLLLPAGGHPSLPLPTPVRSSQP
jgi:hypothetical protein